MADIAPSGLSPRDQRKAAIEQLFFDVRATLAAGKSVNEHSIIAAHPELMPELQQAFDALWSQIGKASIDDTPATQTRVRPGDSTAPGDSTLPDKTIARPGRSGTPTVSGSASAPAGDDSRVGAAGGFAGARSSGRKSQELQIPGYSVQRELSRGGQAVVFVAIQLSTGRKVALKVMHEGPFADERSLARFQREVQILAALDHPNIVSIIDTGKTADGSQFIAMPYITGGTLSDYMHRRQQKDPADPSKLLRMFYKICVAVNEAHLRGIVHRDLKPSNIRVDERGEPHVLDFGLARTALDRFIKGSNEPVSITGEFMGSLPWSSPEQAEGDPEKIDMRTDVYSLGVILYQMLTGGRFPYEVVGNIRDVLNNILTMAPKPPSQVMSAMKPQTAQPGPRQPALPLPVISEAMERIVLKALAKRREQRYQSAGELGKDVARYLLGKPTVASAPGRAENPSDTRVPKREPVAGPPGAGGEGGRKWKFLAAALGVVVVLVAATTLLLIKPSAKTGDVNSSPETREARNNVDSTLNRQPTAPTVSVPAPSQPPLVNSEWVTLFGGDNLDHWIASPIWGVTDGAIVSAAAPPRIREPGATTAGSLRSSGEYGYFDLQLVTKIIQGNVASVGLDSNNASVPGFFVTIGGYGPWLDASRGKSGDIWVNAVMKSPAPKITLQPDQWFNLEVIYQGTQIRTLINGAEVAQFADPELAAMRGKIQISKGAFPQPVQFKDIRIRELPAPAATNAGLDGSGSGSTPPAPAALSLPPAGAWVDLFDGQDLQGWRAAPVNPRGPAIGPPAWNVVGGAILGTTPPRPSGGILYTGAQFQDFHMELTTMLAQGRNTSISFRRDPAPGPDDLSVHLGADNDPGDAPTTGSVFMGEVLKAAAKPTPLAAGEWFTLEITAQKKRIVVTVNRQTVVDFTDADTPVKRGCIALRIATASTLRFKNIRIMDLDAPTGGSAPPSPAAAPAAPAADLVVAANTGAHVDLLALVDPASDAIVGSWTNQNDGLTPAILHRGQQPLIEIPYIPPEEYDYRVKFVRTIGDDTLDMVCQAGGRQFSFSVGAWHNKVAAFGPINNVRGDNNSTTKRSNAWIQNGQEYLVEVKVRKTGLEAYLDGVLITSHQTDYSDMNVYRWNAPRHSNTLALCVGSDTVLTVESAEVIEVTGHGKLLRPAPDGSASPHPATVLPATGAAATGKWIAIFDGRDFTGWDSPDGRRRGPAPPPWQIADGTMVGRGATLAPGSSGGYSVLNASNLYGDFRLRTSTMLAEGIGGQIRFFGPNDPANGPRFLVTVAGADPASDAITGGIMVNGLLKGAAKKVALSPGKWFSLEVAHQGAAVTASVNGVQVSSYSDPSLDHLQLRIQFLANANSTARFKDVQLMDLSAPSGGRER